MIVNYVSSNLSKYLQINIKKSYLQISLKYDDKKKSYGLYHNIKCVSSNMFKYVQMYSKHNKKICVLCHNDSKVCFLKSVQICSNVFKII